MEEKKISLTTFILTLIIIALVAIAGFIYVEKENQLKELNEKISDMEQNIEEEKKLENNDGEVKNEYAEITKELDKGDVLYVSKAIKNDNGTYTLKGTVYTTYTVTAEKLKSIINVGTMQIGEEEYTIKEAETKGEYDLYSSRLTEWPMYKIKKQDESTWYLEGQLQIPGAWKLTDKQMEITVESNTIYEDDYTGEKSTVEKVFKDFEETTAKQETNPDSRKTFTFEFKNGKCTKVINYLTSI